MASNETNNYVSEQSLLGSQDSFNDPNDPTASYFKEIEVTRVLLTYFPPIILAIGIFGNVVGVIVLFRLTRNLLPSCLYLCIGAPADLILLFLMSGNDWLTNAFGIHMTNNVMLYNQSLCKFYPFLLNFMLHLSIWLVAAAITETGVVYMRPHRIHKICTLDRARAVVLLIIVLLVSVNTHSFWSYDLVAEEEIKHVEAKPKHLRCISLRQGTNENFIRIVLPITNILVSDLIPLSIVLAFTVIIIARWENLKQPMGKNKPNTPNKPNAPAPRTAKGRKFPKKHFKLIFVTPKDFASVREMHKALLIICIAYLIMLSPKCVYDIFFFIADEGQLAAIRYSYALDTKLELGRAVCSLLMYLFMTSKGYILFAASKTVRRHVALLLICRSCQSKHNSKAKEINRLESQRKDGNSTKPLLKKDTLSGETLTCELHSNTSRERLVNSQEREVSLIHPNSSDRVAHKFTPAEMTRTRAFHRDYAITTV